MKNKYLVSCYRVDVIIGYIEAESSGEALEISQDEEKSKEFPWLVVPTAEFTQVNERAEEDE